MAPVMTLGWVFSGVMLEEGAGGDIVLAWSGVVVLDPGRWGDSSGNLKVTILTGVTAAMSRTTASYHTRQPASQLDCLQLNLLLNQAAQTPPP